MRLYTVFELLLIFLFIALAASRHIDKKQHVGPRQTPPGTKPIASSASATAPSRFCHCNTLMCNCCRDFALPVVSLKGPGCASLAYLNGDSMRLTMSFGDRVLRNITLNGKKPRPVCMGLPGAETRFCGRIYGIQRVGDQFKACLALELRSEDDIEAALRVSCFKFGPDGVKLEPTRPGPIDTDDYDDDDDDYGLGDDDDDDDDDDDFGLADDDDDDDDDDDAENDVDSGDYTGFSALSDEFLEGFFGSSDKKKKPVVVVTAEKSTTAPPPRPAPVKLVKATKRPVTASSVTAKSKVKMSTTPASVLSTDRTTPKSLPTTITEESSPTTFQAEITSTEMSVQVIQDGAALELKNSTSNASSVQIMTTTLPQNTKTEIPTTITPEATTKESTKTDDETDDEEDDDDDDESILDESEEDSTEKGAETKDDDNILDGILGDDSEESSKEEETDDEFRTLRSNHGPTAPKSLPEVKRPAPPALTPEDQERLFPGLSALLRPSPIPPTFSAFAFPPVRSARTHKRMRLPPV